MSAAVIRILDRMGYNDSSFADDERRGLGLRPASPVPAARYRRRYERARQTRSEHRANVRRQIYIVLRLLADSEHEWRHDGLLHDLGIWLNRYRLAISAMQCEPRPELPGGAQDTFLMAAE